MWAGSLRVASVGFVSSRTLATDRDWLFELSVVEVEGSLSFTFTSTFHRPFSVQKFVVLCRYLTHTTLLVCPPPVLRVSRRQPSL